MKQFITIFIILLNVQYLLALCPPTSLLFRSHDGKCNNILNTELGKAHSYYRNGPEGREPYPWAAVPEEYPRGTYAGMHLLPDDDGPRGNIRNISVQLCWRDEDKIDTINHSMFAIMFGQFLNHDFEAQHQVNTSQLEYQPLHTYVKDPNDPTCFPNNIPPAIHGYRCNDTDTIVASDARFSAGTYLPNGEFRPFNNATSFVDLDTVYGRSDYYNSLIRSHTGGKLRMQDSITFNLVNPANPAANTTHTFTNLLPSLAMTGLPVNLRDVVEGDPDLIFTAGDERVNENVALLFFHTLFAREHNRVCDEIMDKNILYKLFPSIFDEVIYNKARAIVIAKYQHIVFEEFFPNSIGQYFKDLLGPYDGYNPLTDPTTSLPFSGAAFRYGHFQIRPYKAIDECGVSYIFGLPAEDQEENIIFLGMTNPFPDYVSPVGLLSYVNGFENVIRGLINERAAPNELSVFYDIHSFSLPRNGVLDLISLDMARSRYNNLPNYQVIRKHYHGVDPVTDNLYGLPGCDASLEFDANTDDPLECFVHITGDVESAQKLKNVYRKVNLIDAIIGVTAEAKVPGTSMSRTSGNIFVDQFRRSRKGDRFFYRKLINEGFFTASEANEILSTTMRDLVIRNFDVNPAHIPANVFQSPDNYRQSLIDSCA